MIRWCCSGLGSDDLALCSVVPAGEGPSTSERKLMNLMSSSSGGTSMESWVWTSHSVCNHFGRSAAITDERNDGRSYCLVCFSPETALLILSAS